MVSPWNFPHDPHCRCGIPTWGLPSGARKSSKLMVVPARSEVLGFSSQLREKHGKNHRFGTLTQPTGCSGCAGHLRSIDQVDQNHWRPNLSSAGPPIGLDQQKTRFELQTCAVDVIDR